jgi:predicted dehydrogenase
MSEFSRTCEQGFAKPASEVIVLPMSGHGDQHVGILRNFADAIVNGAPLIAPAEEGIHSVELANAMLYSTFTGKTVELPLDGAAYERHLQQLIAASKQNP